MSSKVYLAALSYLARREYGRQELQKKLEAQGFSAFDISEALALLISQGYQSDQRFVESFIRLRVSQGYGPLRIRYDLTQRGIEDELIHALLEERDQRWSELAEVVRRKKFGDERPKDFKEKAKQANYLYRHGFQGFRWDEA